ncbi:carbonic anhydrase/acetyltransferase-like protein (isoleucine patch superfamily) [Pseudarthrobacter sp. PvP090]
MVAAPWFAGGVVLPAARIGAVATVGPAPLVIRGETIPSGSYWIGNPFSPWDNSPMSPTMGIS